MKIEGILGKVETRNSVGIGEGVMRSQYMKYVKKKALAAARG